MTESNESVGGTLAERMAALNDGEMFLPMPFIRTVVLPYIAASFVFLGAVYFALIPMLDGFLPKDTKLVEKRRISYQITNFCANFILAACGVYMEYWVLTPGLKPEDKVQNHEEVIFVSCFQLGYQLWAIPVGIFHVSESTQMLIHHIGVIFVSCMSGFLRNGFRYWTPFFYAVIEGSSLPLTIMNVFKDNPSLIKKYPGVYSGIRLVFAASFLILRVYIFVPRLCEHLVHEYLVFSVHPSLPYRIFMSCVWTSAFFLLVLQVYWGALILKGFYKLLTVEPLKKKKTA